MKRFYIILIMALCALTGVARATDNNTFERFYNLTPNHFFNLLNRYTQYNQTDSAMQCANIQASKYGKEKLSRDEIEACCAAFRYMGLEYMQSYCNYQLASGNLLKAEQIADKYDFKQLQTLIAVDRATLTATQNDLENNFAYNEKVIDGFKKAFTSTLKHVTSHNLEMNKINIEITAPNLLYLAIKFDKVNEVIDEVRAYRDTQRRYGVSCNVAEIFCHAIDHYNVGNYEKALEALSTPMNRTPLITDRNFNQVHAMLNVSRYAVLLKSGKRTEALKLLLGHEQSMREKEMTFELLEALHLLSQHYEVDGNEAMANKYSLLYYTTKDEFTGKSRLGKMDEAKLNIELEQTRENVREITIRHREQTIVLWATMIIALLVIAFLAMAYANNRKKLQNNRLLYEKQIALLQSSNKMPEPEPNKPNAPDIAEPTAEEKELLEKIKNLMETSPQIYLEGFGVGDLAELAGSNTKYVSHVINDVMQCNFSALLNEYRIREACKRLLDSKNYGHYTIESIANSVGYKSRTNFIAIFKNIVGITPSAFQKMSKRDTNR